MRVLVGLLVAGSVVLNSADVGARCAQSIRGVAEPVGYNCISLNLSGFPGPMSGAFSSAVKDWNDPSCNEGGISFPEFEVGGNCVRQIDVLWIEGLNPLNEYSAGNYVGSTIKLYSQVRNPSNGNIMSSGTTAVVRDNAAHELGHILGLRDSFSSSCQGFAMGQLGVRQSSPPSFLDRSIRGAECQAAVATNETPAEGGGADPNGPIYLTENAPCEAIGCGPILVDLGRHGFRFTSVSASSSFDIDADGLGESISWVDPSFDDGFLVLDRNSNGTIDTGLELFGNVTSQPLVEEPNGLQALSVFDVALNGESSDSWIGRLLTKAR